MLNKFKQICVETLEKVERECLLSELFGPGLEAEVETETGDGVKGGSKKKKKKSKKGKKK